MLFLIFLVLCAEYRTYLLVQVCVLSGFVCNGGVGLQKPCIMNKPMAEMKWNLDLFG